MDNLYNGGLFCAYTRRNKQGRERCNEHGSDRYLCITKIIKFQKRCANHNKIVKIVRGNRTRQAKPDKNIAEENAYRQQENAL